MMTTVGISIVGDDGENFTIRGQGRQVGYRRRRLNLAPCSAASRPCASLRPAGAFGGLDTACARWHDAAFADGG
jgi:hypothetical protein